MKMFLRRILVLAVLMSGAIYISTLEARSAEYLITAPDGQHLRVAPHFTIKEFACPDCGVRKVSGELLYKLELLRKELRAPIHITSGYRCALHNKKVGGGSHSQHLNGRAADVFVRGVSMARVAEAARRVGFSFVLNEGDHVHVDVRGIAR